MSGRTAACMKTLMHTYSKTHLSCLIAYPVIILVSSGREERNTDVLNSQCQKCFVLRFFPQMLSLHEK